jgi:hypothetical protein
MSDLLISHLHPLVQPWYQKLIAALTAEAIPARIIQGWRDPAYQDKLHAQGISPLTGSSSKHCFCLDGQPASKAFDLGIFRADGSYLTDGTDHRYARAGQLWESYAPQGPAGMVWGGRFVHPRADPDHFEIA